MRHCSTFLLVLLYLFFGCSENSTHIPVIDLENNPDKLSIFGEGLISTPLYERDIAIAPDGNEIIFTLGNYKQSFRSLVVLKKNSDQWGEREILSISGKYQDIEPFYSADGQKLFFASNRPMGTDTTRTDYNIWVAERTADGWAVPTALDTLINTKKDEFYPSVSKNGNLYFTATREDGIGREDIFLSTFTEGKYAAPVVLDSTVNTAVFEFNAYVGPDEDILVFSSFGRADGMGGGDLYYSSKDDEGNWTAAKNMGALINSEKLDYCPFIDWERRNLYFTSDRAAPLSGRINSVSALEKDAHKIRNGMGNIYRITLEALDLN